MEPEQDGNKNQNQSPTQLDFYQAMQDFKIMFPSMEDDVIEEVLRANQGAVDSTIDQLLAMCTDNLNEVLRHNLDKLDEENIENYSERTIHPEPPDLTETTGAAAACSNLNPTKKWMPPLLGSLPPTFLRISPLGKKSHQEYFEDESIALFLQNEEFLSELRVNQDFLSTLDQDVGEKVGAVPDAELFKERLKNMGKSMLVEAVSKNKFAQLSRVFQRHRKNRSVKEIKRTSGESMLLSGEPLLSESQGEPMRKG